MAEAHSHRSAPPSHDPTVPRFMLIATAILLIGVIAVAALSRQGVIGRGGEAPIAAPEQSRALFFKDRSQGGIAVISAETGEVVAVVAPGEGGFLRGVVRGLVGERKQRDITAATPFDLNRYADGRVTLSDPMTGRSIELVSFGETNMAVFTRLFEDLEAAE